MRKLIVLVVVAVLGAACGPKCESAADEADGVRDCVNSGRPSGYCQCFVQHIMDSHSCPDIETSNVSLNDITAACNACAPQFGGTCS